jgi:RNA polymerase sigma-70 factor (ECF subfamily)
VELSDHLFRRESGRLVAALTRILGVHNLALAEDVVQDAFCRAVEVWKVRGVPDNPAAWLMAVAKHRAMDVVRRERTARTFAPELARMLDSEWTLRPTVEDAFAPQAIRDEQLRMMFSCCHPRLREDSQVALVLAILCGFGVDEIASAFLAGRAAVEKRLSRGKRVLAGTRRLFDLTDRDFDARLSAVRRALYLLFSEGYHGASPQHTVRAELCEEAIGLVLLLLEAPAAAQPETYALAGLMHLQAGRVPGRLNAEGELVPFAEQDRTRWDGARIERGRALLDQSATGPVVSAYHLEAAIAAAHATASSAADTDWRAIVTLYDRLMTVSPSPIVALNRAIAVGERDGPEHGLDALRAIDDAERLRRYPFYQAAIGELEQRRGHLDAAEAHFAAAAALARNPAERRFFDRRRQQCARDPLA